MRWLIAASLLAASCSTPADAKDKENYTVSAATEPKAVTTKAEAAFTITIEPAPPWELKAETPLKISLEPSKGVEIEDAVLTSKHLEESTGTVKTELSASEAGDHTIAAKLSFFLCKEDICQRFRHELETRFTARDP